MEVEGRHASARDPRRDRPRLGDELTDQAIEAARERGAIRPRDVDGMETVRRAAAEA